MPQCPNCGAESTIEGLAVWQLSCPACGYSAGGTAYFGPDIEKLDHPTFVVCVVDPGHDRTKVFQMYRKLLNVSPEIAKSLLSTPSVEIMRGPRIQIEKCIKDFESGGAKLSVSKA